MHRLPHLRFVLGHVHGELHELPFGSARHGAPRQRHHPHGVFGAPCACQAGGRSGDGAHRKERLPARHPHPDRRQERRARGHGDRRKLQLGAAPFSACERAGLYQRAALHRHDERDLQDDAQSVPSGACGRILHRRAQRSWRHLRRHPLPHRGGALRRRSAHLLAHDAGGAHEGRPRPRRGDHPPRLQPLFELRRARHPEGQPRPRGQRRQEERRRPQDVPPLGLRARVRLRRGGDGSHLHEQDPKGRRRRHPL